MTMAWVRKYYEVPARRGGRVEYTGCKSEWQGTITSAGHTYINVRLDGRRTPTPFHPTDLLRYLDSRGSEAR